MRVVVPRAPAATLYVYDSDSPFSILVNSYMSDGTPIVPISNGVGVGVPGNATLSSPSPGLFTNMTRTLLPSEYELLDAS